MLSTALVLFLAGLLTILLPCILPLIPIVLGVSVAGKSKWRPLVTIFGMLVSFVGFTFLLQVALSQFVDLADYIHIATFYVVLLFGFGFLTHNRYVQWAGAILGALFFYGKGWEAVIVAAIVGVIAMEIGGRVATWLQQLGTDAQAAARSEFGSDTLFTAFIVGLTLGLVWAPCAGPALSFALSLVRNQPGLRAFALLGCYGIGAAVPLLIVGYGGQWAVHSVRSLTKYTGIIKQVAGVVLILTAIGLSTNTLMTLQTVIAEQTGYGSLGDQIEQNLTQNIIHSGQSSPVEVTQGEKLPVLGKAPEFADLGPWHNSQPLTMASLRGKVVLVDFWTYSCINCIRTLPYVQGYWDKYKNAPFVLVGIHTPEFTFEHVPENVAAAIKQHGLTYPIAQDNNYGTWNAFQNQYWPAKYLIDAQGNIRYTHFGEGNYEETDQAIASLLAEIGAKGTAMPLPSEQAAGGRDQSPETYLSSRNWDSFGNKKGDPGNAVVSYTLPTAFDMNHYYLGGTWQLVNDEREMLQSQEGTIAMKFLGSQINLVMGLEDGVTSVPADVEVDGKKVKSFAVDRHDLFDLYDGAYGEHTMVLHLHGKGVSAYAFTFGS